MNTTPNAKNISFILVVVIVIGLQFAYLLIVYKQDMSTINDLVLDLEDNTRYLSQLKERVAMLPETKKELELMNAQKNALLNTIPLFDSLTKQIVEMERYASLKNIIGLEVDCSIVASEEVDNSICAEKYSIRMIGKYDDIRGFVEGLNSSYQIVNISQININNGIQSIAKEILDSSGEMSKLQYEFNEAFKDEYEDVVEAELYFDVYSRVNNEDMVEIYDPNFDIQVDKKAMFKLKQDIVNQEEDVRESAYIGDESTPIISEKNDSKFTLNIGDILTSGDTYKLGGPEGYLGLISKADTEVKLIINEVGYDMIISDIDGQEETTHVDVDIVSPKLSIISTMRRVEEIVPSVCVCIYNYTDSIMEVYVDGNMLGNIHVFNEENKEVPKGEERGNIRVS